ncbi:MAG: hypothetical protein IPM34_14720 [Saprospiraceae bacterium]|nr:hypothetical protein [Saprospiraceae bacterium]
MKKILALIIASVTISSCLAGSHYYVSPFASGQGDGSVLFPWTLQQAFNAPPELNNPSDTIWVWLREGVYTNSFNAQTSFSCFTHGKENTPIIFRNYNHERVVIDGQLPYTITMSLGNCSYTWLWGLEITNSSIADRDHPNSDRTGNVYCTAENMKFINLLVHDLGSGLDVWKSAKNTEIYGCIIYNIGNNNYNNGNWEGHGHGMYLQNDTVGMKKIHNNIIFNTYGYGMKIWQTTATAALGNFDIRHNVIFNGGAASENLGGVGNNSRTHNFFVVSNSPGNPILNTTIKHNYTFSGTNTPRPPVNAFGLNYGVRNFVLDSNYFTGQLRLGYNNTPVFDAAVTGNKICAGIPPSYGYYLWGFTNSDFPNNSYYAGPDYSGIEYFILPNKYDPNLAHLVIYNWDSSSIVNIRIKSSEFRAGEVVEVINAMNYYDDKTIDTISGNGELNISMLDRKAASIIGSSQNPNVQFPVFGTFVIRKTGKSIITNTRNVSEFDDKIVILPNPCSETATIKFENLPIHLSVQILNPLGKVLFNLKILPDLNIHWNWIHILRVCIMSC